MSTVCPPELMQDRQFWLEFINEYKTLAVLWKQNNFSSRKCRDAALSCLTKKVRTRWSGANVEFVKQRISNFRRTFFNEFEKVKTSRAKPSQNVYVPNLYYYHQLKFLKQDELDDSSENGEQAKVMPLLTNQKTADEQKSSTFSNEFIKIKEQRSPLEESGEKAEIIYEEARPPKRIKLIPITKKDTVASIVFEDETYDNPMISDEIGSIESELKTGSDFTLVDELSELTPEPANCKSRQNALHAHTTDDEFDEIAKRVATHFRKMDPEQCLLAEKLIFDICISGRLNRLNSDTNISNS